MSSFFPSSLSCLSFIVFVTLFLLLFCEKSVVLCDNKYLIHNASELIEFSNNVYDGTNYFGTTVYLVSDIEFDDELSKQYLPPGEYWHGYFKGTFDGQGYTVSNLKMKTDFGYVGLIGYTQGSTVRNVVLDSSCVIASDCPTDNYGLYIGSVLGGCDSYGNPCLVENSVNMATVTFIGNTTELGWGMTFIGGIVGQMEKRPYDVTVRNCVNYGTLERSGNYVVTTYFGGIVGDSQGILIQNCLNYGDVFHNETRGTFYTGGIVGYAIYGENTLENCVSAGRATNMSDNGNTGTLAGSSSSSLNASHCFWTSDSEYGNVSGKGTYTITDSSLVTLNSTVLKELNEYVESNNWNKWILNANNSTVSFETDNSEKDVIFSSQLILLPDLAGNNESNFSGWYMDPGLFNSLNAYEVTEDTKFYSSYGILCTVTFVLNNGGSISSQQTKVIKYNEPYGTLPEISRTGYSFSGWFTEDFGGDKIESDSVVGILNDHSLYAQWVINNYTLTFIFNNGVEPKVMILDYNASINYPEDPTREGYIFSGWDGNVTGMPANNLNITAQWIKLSQYVKITFGSSDLTEKEIKIIIEKYSPDEYFIEKIDKTEDNIVVIVKFKDTTSANNFVESIEISTEITGVNFLQEEAYSLATVFQVDLFMFNLII